MRKLAVVMAVAALVAVGCGKSSKSASSSGTGADTGAAPVKMTGNVNSHGSQDVSSKGGSASLEMEADDYYFGPTFIKAAAGQKLTLELKNEGKVPHTFTTSDGSVDKQLAPDAKATVTLTVPSSGVVTYFCRFHHGQGMQGAVYLNPGDTAPAAAAGSGGSGGSSSTSSSGYGY